MYLLWTLLVAAAPLVVQGCEEEALSRFLKQQRTPHEESLNFTLRGGRGKRSGECDCGEGTQFCFVDKGKKYCECKNNILVIDYPCEDCSCVNGICHASSHCQCQKGYNLRGANNCEPCDCGDGLQCYFYEDFQFCNCWDQFISLNAKCSKCNCGENEVCFERKETRKCPCTANEFIAECDDCDCSGPDPCSYNVTLPICKCLPQYAKLNGICTECVCEGENTMCDFFNGTQACSCKEGFEEHNGTCEECFCGEGHACKFENGSAICICNENYVEHNGTCKECACGESEICEFVDGEPTCVCKENFLNVDGLCTECFCGVGHYCDIMEGKKICMCKKHFVEKDGICEECHCGAGHECEFQNGKKVCLCSTGYAEMDGMCVECSCGNDTACLFSGNEKLCFCKHGYLQKNDECVAICHEDTCHKGSCQVDGDTFRCNCDVGFGGLQCDEEYFVSKEAMILIASLTSVTLFWVVLLAVYCVRRRRKRWECYRKETFADEPDDEVLSMATSTIRTPE